jgi:predicted nucleotidyltransferase
MCNSFNEINYKDLTMVSNDYYKTVNLIKEFLVERNIVIDKFYIFGSRARNDCTDDSDFDFMVVINNDMKSSEKRAMIGDLYRFLMDKNELIVMDIIIKTANKFYSECQELGYLSYTVLNEGIEI